MSAQGHMLSVKDAFPYNGKKEFLRLITPLPMLVSFLAAGLSASSDKATFLIGSNG